MRRFISRAPFCQFSSTPTIKSGGPIHYANSAGRTTSTADGQHKEAMSASGPLADMPSPRRYVCFTPESGHQCDGQHDRSGPEPDIYPAMLALLPWQCTSPVNAAASLVELGGLVQGDA